MEVIKTIAEKYKVNEKEVLNVYKFFERNFDKNLAASMTRDYFKKRGEN